MILESLLLIGLLCLSAFFSGSETALFALSDLELRELERGSRTQRRAVELARRPERTLVTVLLANMVVNVLISVLVTSISLRAFGATGIAVAIPVATILLLLFGEIIPKSLGLRRRRGLAGIVAAPISLLAVLLGPIQIGLERLARFVVGAARPAPLTREELPTLVSIAAEEGQVSPFESRVTIEATSEPAPGSETPIPAIRSPRIAGAR